MDPTQVRVRWPPRSLLCHPESAFGAGLICEEAGTYLPTFMLAGACAVVAAIILPFGAGLVVKGTDPEAHPAEPLKATSSSMAVNNNKNAAWKICLALDREAGICLEDWRRHGYGSIDLLYLGMSTCWRKCEGAISIGAWRRCSSCGSAMPIIR
jgi:hypothetical protein